MGPKQDILGRKNWKKNGVIHSKQRLRTYVVVCEYLTLNKSVGFRAQKVVVNTLVKELDDSVREAHKREMNIMTYHAERNEAANGSLKLWPSIQRFWPWMRTPDLQYPCLHSIGNFLNFSHSKSVYHDSAQPNSGSCGFTSCILYLSQKWTCTSTNTLKWLTNGTTCVEKEGLNHDEI